MELIEEGPPIQLLGFILREPDPPHESGAFPKHILLISSLPSRYLAPRYLSKFSLVTSSKGTRFFLSTLPRLINFNSTSIASLP